MPADLRERLARWLCEAAGTDPDSTSADPSVVSPAWRWHEGTADGVLRLIAEALQEPSEAMRDAFARGYCHYSCEALAAAHGDPHCASPSECTESDRWEMCEFEAGHRAMVGAWLREQGVTDA